MDDALRQHLMSLASTAAVATSTEWLNQFQEAVAYVELVMENNPGRLEEVVKRPDVTYVLEEATKKAKAESLKWVDQAWDGGVLLAKTDGGSDPTTTRLDVLHADLDRIEKDSVPELLAAIATDRETFRKRLARLASRSGMVAEAGTKEGFWASWLRPRRLKTRVVWQVNSANPCAECAWLDGQSVLAGRVFPRKGPLKLKTHGLLVAPPRHPNCRCTLELVPDEKRAPAA